jgi:hypothetical protein
MIEIQKPIPIPMYFAASLIAGLALAANGHEEAAEISLP